MFLMLAGFDERLLGGTGNVIILSILLAPDDVDLFHCDQMYDFT